MDDKERIALKNRITAQDKIIEKLKEENRELKKKVGGRPAMFSEMEKTEIQMYRIQGKSIQELAIMFKCSTRTIERILHDV